MPTLTREVLYARVEAERSDRERRKAEAKARRELLFGQAAAWRSAQDIRGFVASVLADAGDPAPDDLARWAAWARSEADLIDPQRQAILKPPPDAG